MGRTNGGGEHAEAFKIYVTIDYGGALHPFWVRSVYLPTGEVYDRVHGWHHYDMSKAMPERRQRRRLTLLERLTVLLTGYV